MIVLSDGTKVYLNSASSLCYPTVFPPGERRVKLSGEAYFVVAKGERPFIVDTPLEEVKVFGTEFNVMAYEDEEELQTTLVKGSVGVLAKGMEFIWFSKNCSGRTIPFKPKNGENRNCSGRCFSLCGLERRILPVPPTAAQRNREKAFPLLRSPYLL